MIVAVDQIQAGTEAGGATASERIPRGHKMAVAPIALNEPVYKYGQIIGFASKAIVPGDWVHEHNVVMHDFARDYRFAEGCAAMTKSCRRNCARRFRVICGRTGDRRAQLYRRADIGELLRDRRKIHRRGG